MDASADRLWVGCPQSSFRMCASYRKDGRVVRISPKSECLTVLCLTTVTTMIYHHTGKRTRYEKEQFFNFHDFEYMMGTQGFDAETTLAMWLKKLHDDGLVKLVNEEPVKITMQTEVVEVHGDDSPPAEGHDDVILLALSAVTPAPASSSESRAPVSSSEAKPPHEPERELAMGFEESQP